MSAQKQAGVVASVNAGMVAGGNQRPARARLHAKVWGAVLFVVLAVGGMGWLLHAHLHKSTVSPVSTVGQKNGTPAPDLSTYTPDQKAQYYLSQQSYTAAQKAYQQELQSATTSADKVQAYLDLATNAENMKDYPQAYRYAVQADTLAPSEQTAYTAAYAAQQAKANKDAATYYQLAIERLNKSDPGYDYSLSNLQSSLKEVSN